MILEQNYNISGLVAHYPINGNFDGNPLALTPTGGAVGDTGFDGQALGAFAFNGTSSYLYAFRENFDSLFSSSQSWAISLWAYIESDNYLKDAPNQVGIFASPYLSVPNLYIAVYSGGIEFYSRDSNMITITYTHSTSAVKWFHLVMSRQHNGEFSCYVDGVKVYTTTDTRTGTFVSTANDRYYIGCKRIWYGVTDPYAFFKGKVDNLRLYNRALTNEDVTVLFKELDYARVVPREGLAFEFLFNEQSLNSTSGGAYDISGNGNNLAVNGATLTSGNVSKAYEFDGINDVLIDSNISTLNFLKTSSFSGCAWIKTNRYGQIFGKWNVTVSSGWSFDVRPTGKLILNILNSGGGFGYRVETTTNVNDDNWHFVSFTYTGAGVSGIKLYVDGVEKTTTTLLNYSDPGTLVNTPLYVGNRQGTPNPFKGKIREIRIYNKALNSTEITKIYRKNIIGGNQRNLNGLAAYWSFDEGTGVTAYDYSGNNKNGTLVNSPAWVDGKYGGKALSFNGINQYVNFGNKFSFTNGVNDLPFSINFKIKFNNNIPSPAGYWLINKRLNNTKGEYQLLLYYNSQKFYPYIALLNSTVSSYIACVSNVDISPNIWYDLSFTYDGSKTKEGLNIYIQGSLITNVTKSNVGNYNGMTPNDASCILGNGDWAQGAGLGYSGIIDNVSIYNRALSESEIQQLYSPRVINYNTNILQDIIPTIQQNKNIIYRDVSTFGNLSGTGKWSGGALASNGKIYCMPFNSTNILEINPLTREVSTFGNLSGTSKWGGGVLAPNGKIYGIPYNSTSILEINPLTREASTFGNLSGTTKWVGGVLAPNGKIYGIPQGSSNILEINPLTREVSTFGNLSGTLKWYGGVLAPNGKIYCIPFNSTNILEINPLTREVSTFGNLSGTTKWVGGVLAPNGKIYCMPFDSTNILEINPLTREVSTFGNLSGTTKWGGGVLAPNGKIYGIPYNSTSILEINPLTREVSTFGNLSGTTKWGGGVLAPNGKIYGIPHSNANVIEISPTNLISNFSNDTLSGPYLNKL